MWQVGSTMLGLSAGCGAADVLGVRRKKRMMDNHCTPDYASVVLPQVPLVMLLA